MQSLLISALVFACVFGGVLFGMYVRRVLPQEHLGDDTKSVVGLGMGLVGTLTALLLALVTSSAKEAFDFENSQLRQTAVNILVLDRMLADYGPEAGELRAALRANLQRRLDLTWPADDSKAQVLQSAATDAAPYRLMDRIRQLRPQSDHQRELQSQALQQVGEILKARWTLVEETTAAVPVPFLVIVVCWLTLIFASFGLFAPRNATAIAVLIISALSVAGSVFVILELNTPFSGLMKVSGEPLRLALAQLGN
jgi:Protein of unknown function (DUF4239)